MHPILIVTAALVGLPILIHLLMKQEPKRLSFPALRFLQLKKKVNQRKMRLRHFLLLALRMLLLALFGLALFQPTLFSETLNFAAEQPVAVVVVLDTSPGMGYTANGRTRLEEARRRALELLDELPAGSRVAVLDPAEPGGQWEPTVADARKKIEDLKDPRGAAVPVTTALATAYQLLRTVDQETEAAEPLPRLVAVFSDRAANGWDAARTDDLVKLRDAVPAPPPVAHVFVDVGADQPADVAVLSVDLKPQVVARGQPVVLTAAVRATGPAVPDMLVTCRLTTPGVPEQRKPVSLPAGSPAAVTFKFDNLPPGLHQAEVMLDKDRKDNLAADDVRYVTFRVAEPRKVLTIADNPKAADFWWIAHDSLGEFEVVVKTPKDADDYSKYAAVVLLGVADPDWGKVQTYAENGGPVLVIPGGDRDVSPESYDAGKPAAAAVLPGTLKGVVDTATQTPPRPGGVPWVLDEKALRHPLLAPFREWKLANYDVATRPRSVWKFWDAVPAPGSTVVATYDDPGRHPAALEKAVGGRGGKVLLLTTRMDTPGDRGDQWHDYWESLNSWNVVFPNRLLRYLAGDPAEANFNFVTGQPVAVVIPAAGKFRVEGPGVSGRDAEGEAAAGQREIRLPPAQTQTPGNFVVAAADGSWREGFSLNPPPGEWDPGKVPAEAVEGLFGANAVVPVGKDVKLSDALKRQFNQPVDLFPWLLIGVLFLIAAEGWVANRFYRAAA